VGVNKNNNIYKINKEVSSSFQLNNRISTNKMTIIKNMKITLSNHKIIIMAPFFKI
jgi:hypothetical protein